MIMKKKTYIEPAYITVERKPLVLLGVSGLNRGIGYGGVDTNGSQEAAARTFDFDDEDIE